MTALPASLTAWGAHPEERDAPSPADALVPGGEHWVRAIDVAAPPALTWRWVCQLRAAPYSYDWIDNRGRRSPQELTPGLEALGVGQRLLTIFRVASFTPGKELTILCAPTSRLLPPFAMAYLVTTAPGGSRIAAHLRVGAPPALPGPLARAGLAALCAGDLVMIRRQLLNFRALAERDAARAA